MEGGRRCALTCGPSVFAGVPAPEGREQSAVAGGPSASAAARWTDSRGVDVTPRGDIAREASLAHQPGEGEVRRQCASGDRVAVVDPLR
jgi:hypothetical protein